jgi:hypothetical protein
VTHNFSDKRKALIEYMKVKLEEGDWHGVSDAANDLRVLEANNSASASPAIEHLRDALFGLCSMVQCTSGNNDCHCKVCIADHALSATCQPIPDLNP